MQAYDGQGPLRMMEHDWAEPDLFVLADEKLVDWSEGATFQQCTLDKHTDPILHPDEPWEGGSDGKPGSMQRDALDGSVLHDPYSGLFHLWYRTHSQLAVSASSPEITRHREGFRRIASKVCHATSADGVNWVKSQLGRVVFEGSASNNMIDMVVSPMIDDHLSGVIPNYTGQGPSLVATAYSRFADPIYHQGIIHLFSDNGMDWSCHYPPALPIDGDAHALMWDSRSQCYLCTTRSASHDNTIRRLRQRGLRQLELKRHIALAKSRDLVHWTPMSTILEADEFDPPNAQLYHMYILPYGHFYLGFVQLFYMEESMHRGPLDVHLCYSRDLVTWHRMGSRQPFLARGPLGAWDHGAVILTTNRPHPEGNRMRFWFGGTNAEHWQIGDAALSTGTLRRDGFACWHAGPSGGSITTVPLQMNWATQLMLNMDAADGEIRVELCDETGHPLPGCAVGDCLPLRGDHIRILVQFDGLRGNFIRHTGRVRIRVHMRNAKVYAIKATNISCMENG